MSINNEVDGPQNLLLDDSSHMNQQERAIFLNISKSRSVDSIFNKLLPHPNEIPDRDRTLVWQPIQPQLTNNIIINSHSLHSKQQAHHFNVSTEVNPGLKIFKSNKKPKVKTKCDYDKNICGYITKKHYLNEIQVLMKKYQCNFDDCRSFYLKKIEVITGPSHLNELLNWNTSEPQSLRNCKKAFKQFYIWFLKYRYLRYLIHEGKMTNKMAYIQYKNTYLFRYISDESEPEKNRINWQSANHFGQGNTRQIKKQQQRDEQEDDMMQQSESSEGVRKLGGMKEQEDE